MTCALCREATTDSNVKVEEGNRKAIFQNTNRRKFYKTRVDGCVVKNAVAADYVVTKHEVGDVIVELKGRDVDHAAEQVFATANQLSSCKSKRGPKIAGLIVCAQYPRIDTKIQNIKQKFAKQFQAPLHVVTRNDTFVFERVLAFDGPR